MSEKFKILDGLPPYGTQAISFPLGQLFSREGLVIKFNSADNLYWIGNFKKGDYNFDKVLRHPDGMRVIVCAGGEVFVVDPDSKSVSLEFGPDVTFAEAFPKVKIVVLGDTTSFLALDSTGVRWETPRLSWDGFRKISTSSRSISGEAFSPIDNGWHPFEIQIDTGLYTGGSFEDLSAQLIPIVKK